MKKLFLMLLVVIVSFTMVSCGNRSEKFNDYIESFEFEENDIVFYNTENYYINGIFYNYTNKTKAYLLEHDYRVNRTFRVKSTYIEDEYMYFLVIHFGDFKDVYNDSLIDESLLRVNLETFEIEMMYSFGTTNVTTSYHFIGISNHKYFIYRDGFKVYVLDMETGEIVKEYPFYNQEAYQYKDNVLTIYSEGVLYQLNLETNISTHHTFDDEYTHAYILEQYIKLTEGLDQAIYDLNTFEEVSPEVLESYLISKIKLLRIGDEYHEMIMNDYFLTIGDLEITLEEFIDETPILTGLIEMDSRGMLNLKFSQYIYLNETTFIIGVEHHESGFMTVDETYQLMFKYEIGGGISYLGFVGSDEDVVMWVLG